MKHRWLISLIACIPMAAALLAIQSCGGVGGPVAAGGGGTSVSSDFLALLSTEQKASAYIGNEACADCHGGRDQSGYNYYQHWQQTKHATEGVGCEKCHGPGGAHKANPTKDNILTLPRSGSPVVCAQCHGPLNDQYNYSAHKEYIDSPVSGASTSAASTKSSRCIACHSGLFRATVYDQGKDIADFTDDQLMKIAQDTIAVAPHSANCATCHDPHAATGNTNADGEEKQLRHKSFNTDTTQIAPGTTAAVFTKFNHICAQCHNGRGGNPADSALTTGTSRPNMHDSNQFNMLMGLGGSEGTGVVDRNTAHATAPGQCSKCHMPDARHSFTVSYDKSCSPCHTAADAAARATSIKSEILNELLALQARLESWANTAFGNTALWDYTSLIAAEGLTAPNQSLVPIQIKRARHNYYFIIRSGDYGVHNAPYAKTLLRVANENLDALSVPKAPGGRSSMSTADKLALIKQVKDRAMKAEISELR
ncbi:MAG: cytochrome c3 family protein [Armatimonadetes bacterium]|nr:cytochrome c3 family protein [Armatimonadota bacterium]